MIDDCDEYDAVAEGLFAAGTPENGAAGSGGEREARESSGAGAE